MSVICVEYSATIAAATGVSEENLPAAEIDSVESLLEALAAKHGEQVRGIVLDAQGELLPSVLVAVNDDQIMSLTEAKLNAGDRVMILSAVGGG